MSHRFSLLLLSLLIGCGNPVPESSVYEPMPEEESKRILKEHRAISVEGHEGIWLQGKTKESKSCKECHASSQLPIEDRAQQAHGEIKLKHASFMECSTCHSENTPSSLQFGKKRVDLKQSHQLCSSCHSSQGADFILGTHGKRVTGWKGPRVIKSCTSCHDPHEPSFKALPTIAHPQIIPDRLGQRKEGHHE